MKIQYKENIGSVIRGLLNGVKHTAQTFAALKGLDANRLEMIMSGSSTLTSDVEKALASHPGINQKYFYPMEARDAFPVIDDTVEGVLSMTFEETKNTARTISRGLEKTPYYIYADTALSNLSLFRPEWIKMLYAHNGETTDIPDWAFNKGHFEHQITYFIGPVNFYWIDGSGKKYVRQMNTGDVNYITPFVPHSFTTRKEGEGLILAVTYGGAAATDKFQAKIKSMELENYLREIKKQFPSLLNNPLDEYRGVLFKTSGTLSGIPYQQKTRVEECETTREKEKIDSEIWGYNISNASFVLQWGSNEKEIGPGDSFFIRPNVQHSFKKKDGAKLLIIEIRPEDGDSFAELALIHRYSGENGLKRAHTETTRWY